METEQHLAVEIDGKWYTREELEALPREPDLRNLARWIKAHVKPNTSGSWIGSMASKDDLVAFCLNGTVTAMVKGDGNFVTRGSNDLSTLSNGSASQNGSSGKNAASLMMQAVQAIAESSVNIEMLEERIECASRGLREEFEALVAKGPKASRFELVKPDGAVVNAGIQHKQFAELVQLLNARVNVALVGPAGSGKTRAMEEAAKALELEFEAISVGPQTTQSQLMGYMDANGNYVSTAFRRRFEQGGAILLDEFDAANAGVGTCVNAATANKSCGFPDRLVSKHGDFVCGISMNTWGQGASREYVGRNQLDGATLDRFVFLEWNYDEELERAIALGFNPEAGAWVDRVQALRRNAQASGLRVIISPRASEMGAKLLAGGFDFERLEKILIFKGHDAATVNKLRQAA